MKTKKGIPVTSRGQWDFPGQPTIVPSPTGQITMQGVPYPVMGMDETGHTQMMMPGGEYMFPGHFVYERPMMQGGGEMIRRADGSYSQRGLWDNIRANRGSGKAPTKEMLEQERKIRNEQKAFGGITGWLDNYQEGGPMLDGRVNNISPEGDVDFQLKTKGKLSGKLSGSVNVPGFGINGLHPSVSYQPNSNVVAYGSADGFGAQVKGGHGYADYNQQHVGPDTFRNLAAGYNSEKLNVNANARLQNNSLVNAGIQGGYNLTPNLSLNGNYNFSKGDEGDSHNYFAGLRYQKTFDQGGEWLDPYQEGGDNLPELNSKIDVANFYKNPLSEKYGVSQNPQTGRFEYYLKNSQVQLPNEMEDTQSKALEKVNLESGFSPNYAPKVSPSVVLTDEQKQKTLRRLENEEFQAMVDEEMRNERIQPPPALTEADFPVLPPEPKAVSKPVAKTQQLPAKKKAVQAAVHQSAPVHTQTAAGPPQPPVLPNNIVNLADATMTAADLVFLNNTPYYCPGGNCLETTRKAYDLVSSRIPGMPTSSFIWDKDLHATSTNNEPSASDVKKYPWYKGDEDTGSVDSWDIHGNIVAAGGKNIYNANDPKRAKIADLYPQIPVGAIIGYGPKGSANSTKQERNQGYNKQFGLQPSHHSTQVVGYTPQGEPIVYDGYLEKYVPLSQMEASLQNNSKVDLNYEIENISVPKSVAGKTRQHFQQQGNLLNYVQPLNADPNKIISAGNQPWAQIKDGSSTRKPEFDAEALQKFTHSLKINKGMLMQNLGLSSAEYDELARTAIALSAQETEGGGALGVTDMAGNTQGMTQLTLNNVTKDDRLRSARSRPYHNNMVIDSESDLRDPKGSAVATMMHLSQLKKDAERMYRAGSTPQTRTFNENSGVADMVRSNTARYNGDGFFLEEVNKRVDLSPYEGGILSDAKVAEATAYLNKTAGTKDKYKVIVNSDGDLQVQMKTPGNNAGLTTVQKIAYAWQSPNTLLKGDAAGTSQYVQRVNNYYNAITPPAPKPAAPAPKKNARAFGGDTGWLDKYN